MTAGQDLQSMSTRQMNAMEVSPKASEEPLITQEVLDSLNHARIGTQLIADLTNMYRNPVSARPTAVVGISSDDDLTGNNGVTLEAYKGRDLQGKYLYKTALHPDQIAALSNNQSVIAMDEWDTFNSQNINLAVANINPDRVCKSLKAGCNLSDGMFVTTSQKLPDLAQYLPYPAKFSYEQDQDENFVYSISTPSLMALAYLSQHKDVLEIVDAPTHYARHHLSEEGLPPSASPQKPVTGFPKYKPSQKLVDAFEQAVYKGGALWGLVNKAAVALQGKTLAHDDVERELNSIAQKSFMPFLNQVFKKASRGEKLTLMQEDYESLIVKLRMNLPSGMGGDNDNFDVKNAFATQMAGDILDFVAEKKSVFTTYANTETLELSKVGDVYQALRLQRA